MPNSLLVLTVGISLNYAGFLVKIGSWSKDTSIMYIHSAVLEIRGNKEYYIHTYKIRAKNITLPQRSGKRNSNFILILQFHPYPRNGRAVQHPPPSPRRQASLFWQHLRVQQRWHHGHVPGGHRHFVRHAHICCSAVPRNCL